MAIRSVAPLSSGGTVRRAWYEPKQPGVSKIARFPRRTAIGGTAVRPTSGQLWPRKRYNG